MPGFIIEELKDGRVTVLVPSVPTPLAGAVYIIERARVHELDIPFTDAIKSISRWGAGRKSGGGDAIAAAPRVRCLGKDGDVLSVDRVFYPGKMF